MAKVVFFVDDGKVSYIGSNLESLEIVVVDKDNLSEMGYSNDDVNQILAREMKGLKEANHAGPIESTEFMVVQSYKEPTPWEPKEGEWCWFEIDGLSEFKLAKYVEPKAGQNVYKFDGVLPMAEILNQEMRIDPRDVIDVLKSLEDPKVVLGDFWHKIHTPVADAPFGYDVNVWDDGYALRMTAYALVKGEDGKLRTSSLHPLRTHEFTHAELRELLDSSSTPKQSLSDIQQIAANSAGGGTLEDAMNSLMKSKSQDLKV